MGTQVVGVVLEEHALPVLRQLANTNGVARGQSTVDGKPTDGREYGHGDNRSLASTSSMVFGGGRRGFAKRRYSVKAIDTLPKEQELTQGYLAGRFETA